MLLENWVLKEIAFSSFIPTPEGAFAFFEGHCSPVILGRSLLQSIRTCYRGIEQEMMGFALEFLYSVPANRFARLMPLRHLTRKNRE